MTQTEVIVTIENLAPEQGTFLTPVWVGFHNGNFDIYDRGRPASPGLERIAEDGDFSLISQEFTLSEKGSVDGAIAGTQGIADGPIDPGEIATATFTLDSDNPNSQFFSYLSMVIPSNDAFIGNDYPNAIPIFDDEGNFIGADLIVYGNRVLDAGTEVNDEAEATTAFLGQTVANTGVTQNGVVDLHPGFLEGGRILTGDSSSSTTNADFTAPDYQVARITVSTVEQPLPLADPVKIISNLDGSQELSGGEIDAQGTSFLTLNDQGNALEYNLTVSGLDFGLWVTGDTVFTEDSNDDVSAIHLHNAARGENGEVVFDISQDDDLQVTSNDDGSVTLTGVWEETDVANTPLSNFVADIRHEQEGQDLDLYWNVHTEEFADGAIRGQLVVGNEDNNPPSPELVEVTVKIENLAPENGTFLTPLWTAFHDGTFDTYDRGRIASPGLESLAEDGDTSLISHEFISSGAGLVDGLIVGTEKTEGSIDPGETTSYTFTLDSSLATSRFFSYASMVIPSNDAFIGNGITNAIEVFNENGEFLGADFIILGNEVRDAGTEVNDEQENSTAFFGQTEPNTGTEENGVVSDHPGFIEGGRILSEPTFTNADFTTDDYQLARITITAENVEQLPLGSGLQDNGQGQELVDLRGVNNQEIEVNFSEVSSEAGLISTAGFYVVRDINGTVIDEFGNAVHPGDQGYAEAALARRVIEMDVNNTGPQQLSGGDLLAPFLVTNGTPEEFLEQSLNNTGVENIQAYFSFLGANQDRANHIHLHGNNHFVFEDFFGGGDNDFNDLSFQAEFSVI
jgi:hypothetical protein